ncbi:hypothetical protein BG003_008797 [Podila horticola]|nr:hypothetical protein BG003_008797 [Podila horticola]
MSCTGLVAAMYDFDPTLVAPQPWPTNYLSYLRIFRSNNRGSSTLVHLPDRTPVRTALKRHIVEHRLVEKYTSLAIGSTILEQLRSIVIPLTDIDRYLNSVAQLSSLESVTFQLDGIAEVSEYDIEYQRECDQEILDKRMAQRLKNLESAIKFIQTHAVLFRGTLRQVFVPTDSFRPLYPQSCPESYLSRMLESLPSLINPTTLTDVNWKQFVAKSEQTDVTHVTSIEVHDDTGPWYQQLKSKHSFLHQCRSLKEYKMVSLGPNSFKSNDRKDHQGPEKDAKLQLPFLEHVSILAYNEPFGSELDDIGKSCGETIQYFNIRGHLGPQGDTSIPPVRIGDHWKMRVLSKLFVQMGSERLIVDPDFLRHCPSLEFLSLTDNHRTYVLNEIEVGDPAVLPNLIRLRLYGTASLSFHPGTLHSTKKLETLVLGAPDGFDRVYHPSIHVMDHTAPQPLHTDYEDSTGAMFRFPRPEWTFDWFLPNLVNLELSVGFALHFRFQMLACLPNVEELVLSIFAQQSRVERVLTKEDFTLDPTAAKTVCCLPVRKPVEAISLHTLTDLDHFRLGCRFTDARPQTEPVQFPHIKFQPPIIPRNVQRQQEEQVCRNRMFGRRRGHDMFFRHGGDYRPNVFPSLQPSEANIHIIERQLAQDHLILQPILDKFIEEKRAIQEKEREESERQRQFQLAHPECLVVPSLKRLEIYGHWIMSEEVLEFMLGRVFWSIEAIVAYQCEGYEDEAWLRITSAMPHLKSVNQAFG